VESKGRNVHHMTTVGGLYCILYCIGIRIGKHRRIQLTRCGKTVEALRTRCGRDVGMHSWATIRLGGVLSTLKLSSQAPSFFTWSKDIQFLYFRQTTLTIPSPAPRSDQGWLAWERDQLYGMAFGGRYRTSLIVHI